MTAIFGERNLESTKQLASNREKEIKTKLLVSRSKKKLINNI